MNQLSLKLVFKSKHSISQSFGHSIIIPHLVGVVTNKYSLIYLSSVVGDNTNNGVKTVSMFHMRMIYYRDSTEGKNTESTEIEFSNVVGNNTSNGGKLAII